MLDAQKTLELIHSYAEFVGALCFLIAFLGSLIGINLIVPSGTFLTAVGVFVGAGTVPWTIGVWAALGAALGSSASYTAGLRLGSSLRRSLAWRSWANVIDRAQELFQRYGFVSVLIGYFSGPLRAPVAAMAGVAGMRRVKFEAANLFSAFAWAAFAVGVGAAPGSMIDPDSPWLLVAPFLAPLVTIAVSLAILLGRKAKQRIRARTSSSPT